MYVNARSRRGQEWFRNARECIQQSGQELTDYRTFRDPRELSAAVKGAVARGVPLIAVGGGDGTFSMVANHFVGHDSVLGVLPLGTGNAFARDLGIPATIADACSTIVGGKTVSVDLGYAGDDYFVNVTTVGLTECIVRELTDEAKRRLGRAVYAVAMCRALVRVKPFRAVLSTSEGRLDFETLQVVIGNGRFHAGPFPLAPDASITEGRLTVYGLANTSRSSFLRLAWHMRTGRHVELPEVHAISTVGGRLEASPPQHTIVDGEPGMWTPIDFRVVPGALRVRVPKSFAG